MPRVEKEATLTRVEHILGSGTGTLDFAIEGENTYYTWEGSEDSNWSIENIERIENDEEDRFILFPEGEYFSCEVSVSDDGKEILYCES